MDNSDLSFFQSVTAEFFYVSNLDSVEILHTGIKSATKSYCVRWSYAGRSQVMYLLSQDMKRIANSMECLFGSTSVATQAWNAVYLKCYHDENCALITFNDENK